MRWCNVATSHSMRIDFKNERRHVFYFDSFDSFMDSQIPDPFVINFQLFVLLLSK